MRLFNFYIDIMQISPQSEVFQAPKLNMWRLYETRD